MKPHARWGWWVLAFGAASCVSSGDYELVEVQLDATRMALSTRQAACNAQQVAADDHIVGLEQEIAARQAQLDVLSARDEADRAACTALAERHAELLLAVRDPAAPPKESIPLLTATRDDVVASIDRSRADEAARVVRDADVARVEAGLAPLVAEGWGTVHRRGEAVVLRIAADHLFNENSVVLSPRGRLIVARLGDALEPMNDRRIEIEGHTSSVPHHSAAYASNWELGFGFAVTVLRGLQGEGVRQPVLAASLADTLPISSEAFQNARVEVVVLADRSVPTRFSPTPPEPEPGPDLPPPPAP